MIFLVEPFGPRTMNPSISTLSPVPTGRRVATLPTRPGVGEGVGVWVGVEVGVGVGVGVGVALDVGVGVGVGVGRGGRSRRWRGRGARSGRRSRRRGRGCPQHSGITVVICESCGARRDRIIRRVIGAKSGTIPVEEQRRHRARGQRAAKWRSKVAVCIIIGRAGVGTRISCATPAHGPIDRRAHLIRQSSGGQIACRYRTSHDEVGADRRFLVVRKI